MTLASERDQLEIERKRLELATERHLQKTRFLHSAREIVANRQKGLWISAAVSRLLFGLSEKGEQLAKMNEAVAAAEKANPIRSRYVNCPRSQ
jgi:hypothetical protein